jgi:magnesium-protoporphyrin O-methyltransferase
VDGCGCDDYATPIDAGIARSDRDSYHRDGPDTTTRMLLDMIEANSGPGATVLDIGGGIGVIGLELLRTRASRCVLVEASPDYLEAAHEEARAAGLLDRIEIVAGDFMRRAADIDAADIVTLDRVVCCYPDADGLVSSSAVHAKRLYGLVLPRDRWYVRWGTKLDNVRWWLRRRGYRAYAHANARIDEQVRASGLVLRSEAFTRVWRVVLYAREDAGEPDST